MDEELLSTLSCPYCGYPLELEEVLDENNSEIINAIVKCECGEYPIAEGILVLRKGHNIERAVGFLAKKLFQDTLNTLLEARPFTKTHRLISRFSNSSITIFNKLALIWKKRINNPLFKNHKLSFFGMMDRLRWGNYGEYLKYRLSDSDFFANSSLIHYLMDAKKVQKPVLDLCCGVGHHSFLLSAYVPTENIVCADLLFVNLYLARRFFVENANFVCLDANEYLPFENDYFSSILCSDAFFAMESKRLLANELKRVINSHGFLLLSGLPNSLKTGRKICGRETLPPRGYLGLFGDDLNVRLLPQEEVIKDFLMKDELNLEKIYSEVEVNDSVHIALVGTKDSHDFKVYDNFGRELFERIYRSGDRELILNPMYIRRERDGNIYLTKHLPMRGLKNMKEKYVLKKELLKLATKDSLTGSELDEIYDLWRDAVLIVAPKNYVDSKSLT